MSKKRLNKSAEKAYRKVLKVIDSCENKQQFDDAGNMVASFYYIFGKSKSGMYEDLSQYYGYCAYRQTYLKNQRMVFPFR